MKHLTLMGVAIVLLCAGTRLEAQGVASTFDQLSVLVNQVTRSRLSIPPAEKPKAESRCCCATG